jgi:hypothetical protein
VKSLLGALRSLPLRSRPWTTDTEGYLFKDGKLVWMDTHASTEKQAQDVLSVVAQQP